MDFQSESQLEHAMFEEWFDGIRDALHADPGPAHYAVVRRQMQVGSGRLDLIEVGFADWRLYARVYELKNELATPAHVAQVCRYSSTLRRFLALSDIDEPVRIDSYLVAPGFHPDALLLCDAAEVGALEFSMSASSGLAFDDVAQDLSTSDECEVGWLVSDLSEAIAAGTRKLKAIEREAIAEGYAYRRPETAVS